MKRFWIAFVAMVLLCLATISVSEARPPQRFFPGDDWTSPYHLVQRGETLSGIAKLYTNPVRDLRDANGIVGDRIYAGEYLRLPDSWFGTTTTITTHPLVKKENTAMPFDSSLFVTLLFFAFIVFVIGMIMYFLGRRPHNHHCNCGNAHYPYCLPAPAPVLTIPPITVNPIQATVNHTFPSGGVPVSVTMTTPPAPAPKTP
jgi:LysM repeat protein